MARRASGRRGRSGGGAGGLGANVFTGRAANPRTGVRKSSVSFAGAKGGVFGLGRSGHQALMVGGQRKTAVTNEGGNGNNTRNHGGMKGKPSLSGTKAAVHSTKGRSAAAGGGGKGSRFNSGMVIGGPGNGNGNGAGGM
jgi:hypothetical protein